MFREVEVSYVEVTKEEGKLKKLVEILSEAVYAHLRQNGAVCKESTLSGEEN